MLIFGKAKITKEIFYGAKKPIKIWDVDADNIVILKSIETKERFECLIWYLHLVIRPLVLMMLRMGGYVKTFNDNKFMPFRLIMIH